MSITVIAPASTADTSFVETQLSALRKAYLASDVVGAFTLAEALLAHLGEYPDETNRQAAGAARLFRGWAYLVQALGQRGKDALYPTSLQLAFEDLDRALTAFLANDDTLVERVTAEGYLAYTKCLLGMNEEADRHLTYLEYAVGGGKNLPAMTVFLQIKIAIMRMRGEITSDMSEIETSPTVAPMEDDQVTLSARHEAAIRNAMMAEEPDQVLEMTAGLLAIEPHDLCVATSVQLRQAHVWALLKLAQRAGSGDRHRRDAFYNDALPYLRELADGAFERRDTRTYVSCMLDLVYILYTLGQHDAEAQRRMAQVTAFVRHSGIHSLHKVWSDAQVRIDTVVLQRSFATA